MSNLKLPRMNYRTLKAIADAGGRRKIAYATDVEAQGEDVLVFHHGHRIAIVSKGSVIVNNQDYHTRTTSARLHAIVGEAAGYRVSVGIRQGVMELRDSTGSRICTLTGDVKVGNGGEVVKL